MKKILLMPGGIVAVVLVLAYLVLMGESGEEAAQTSGPGIEAVAENRSTLTEPESDLPPEGTRSLFDHLIRENGSLPYPFERVIDMLAAYDEQGTAPNSLMIPDGRSLLKGHADFTNPRIVVAADMKPPQGASISPYFKGRLFLGFVEDADEIEVISFNEEAGRFEFQLVENYCEDCVPRIVYAKRAICKTCHAAGAPIFPVRPWEETNVQAAIQERIAPHINGDRFFGAPLERRLDDAEAFDNFTDIGNVLQNTQLIWREVCAAKGPQVAVECRRQMLRLALQYSLNPTALDSENELIKNYLATQSQVWPAGGVALPDGDLNNRNPLLQALYDDSFGAQLKRLLFAAEDEAVVSGDKLKAFDSLPPLPAEFDPLTPRAPKKMIQAHELDAVYGLAQIFAPQDIEALETAAGYQAELLDQTVLQVDEALFNKDRASRVEIINALLAGLGQPSLHYAYLDTSEMSAPIAQGEPPLELAADSVLKPFEKYCFACHRGNPSARLDFMSGPDEETVLAKIQETDAILDALDYERYLGSRKESQLMPPADTWQRKALEDAMKQGETPLEKMRAEVPDLFEF